jgi:hypothetical protein
VGAYGADAGNLYSIKKYNVGKSYVVFGKKDTYSIEFRLRWRPSGHYDHALIRQ